MVVKKKKTTRGKNIGKFGAVGGTYLPSAVVSKAPEIVKPYIRQQPQTGFGSPKTVDNPYIQPRVGISNPRVVERPYIPQQQQTSGKPIPALDYNKIGSNIGLFGKKKSVKKSKRVGKSKYRRTIREKERFLKHVILFER